MFRQKLDLTHTEEVLALSEMHSTHMGIDKNESHEFGRKFWIPFLDPGDHIHQLIGVREHAQGELLGVMGAYLWEGFPYYTITGMTLKPGYAGYSYKTNPLLKELWSTVLINMEKHGRNKFYMFKNNKWRSPKMIKQWHEYVGQGRYILNIDEVIPAGQKSRWAGHMGMMAGKTYPMETHIMCGTRIDETLNGKIL